MTSRSLGRMWLFGATCFCVAAIFWALGGNGVIAVFHALVSSLYIGVAWLYYRIGKESKP